MVSISIISTIAKFQVDKTEAEVLDHKIYDFFFFNQVKRLITWHKKSSKLNNLKTDEKKYQFNKQHL